MASNCVSSDAAAEAPRPQVTRARVAIGANFLLYGVAISSWAPMVPYVKARLGLDERTLGFVMLGMGAGGLLTLPISGMLSHRYGTRVMTWIGAPCVCTFMPLLALAPTPLALSAALFGFSASLGAMGIGMNSQAIEIDRLGRKPVLSRIHGIYSVGALSGSALMSALLRMGVSLPACAASLAACMAALSLSQRNHLLPGQPAPKPAGTKRRFVMPPKRVVLLGLLCAILFMGEGAMLDWSAVFLSSNRGLDAATAGFGFTAYAVAMTASRFLGDLFTHRFGQENALRFGALCAAAGILCAVGFSTPLASFVGFALVGFGLANTVPVVFAASGRVSDLSAAAALPIVTTLGYIGLLAGPALIGVIAKAVTLSTALSGVAALLLFVSVRARTIRPL
jgi:predicted MFS family arabinose efflux permease